MKAEEIIPIEDERRRTYTFPDGTTIVIQRPRFITIKYGKHIIWDSRGVEYIIPATWEKIVAIGYPYLVPSPIWIRLKSLLKRRK